jgi:type I restriction enzyme M protein
MLENKREWKANATFGRDKLQPMLNEISKATRNTLPERAEQLGDNIGIFAQDTPQIPDVDWAAVVRAIVREFAKLDGYDIKLRTLEVFKQEEPLPESKSWAAPVRVLLRNDDWHSPDGAIQGSHDEHGEVRPEYLEDPTIYENEQDNIIKQEWLDPSCIEANDYNLSAGRYRPFKPVGVESEPPDKLIRELQGMEREILSRLGRLLEMVEGRG